MYLIIQAIQIIKLMKIMEIQTIPNIIENLKQLNEKWPDKRFSRISSCCLCILYIYIYKKYILFIYAAYCVEIYVRAKIWKHKYAHAHLYLTCNGYACRQIRNVCNYEKKKTHELAILYMHIHMCMYMGLQI